MRTLVAAGADPLATTDDESTVIIAAEGYAYSMRIPILSPMRW